MRSKYAWASMAAVALMTAAGAAPAAAQIQQSTGHYHEGELGQKYLLIEQHLRCSCGCGLDVHSCQFQMQCETSPEWSTRIRRDLDAGMSVEAIEASFVADFGATVLMAPPPEGFNLVGYLMPAFALVSAGMLVGLVARGGTRRGVPVPVSGFSAEDEGRVGQALKRLEESERPDW